MTLRAAIIGCGRPWKSDGATGFGMSHAHAFALKKAGVELVAAADISEENARAFQETHGVEKTYSDYHEMLASEKFDWVSICTWPHVHADMVVAAAESGARAIHCEKPMATNYGDAKRMVAACQESGSQLTFNHQRRFGAPFQKARELVQNGAIGELKRMEARCGDLFDWGTHWIDMMFFFNAQTPVEWVIGQIDLRGAHKAFGAPMEGSGISHFGFQNGVDATLLAIGDKKGHPDHRLIGTQGMIEVGVNSELDLRMMNETQAGWQNFEEKGIHGGNHIDMSIADGVEALQNGRTPLLSGDNALQATEVIFATYESARRGGRIELPLDIEDSPLQAMLDAAGITL